MAEVLEPSASVSAVAHRLYIHPPQFFGRCRVVLDARKISTEPAHCEVVAASAAEPIIEIVIGGMIVRGRADVSEAHLQQEMVATAEQLLAGTGWLPPLLRAERSARLVDELPEAQGDEAFSVATK